MSQIELASQIQANNYKKESQIIDIWRRLKKNKAAIAGFVIICIFVLVAIFADVLADYNKLALKQNYDARLLPPCMNHIFGTDEYGRDVFARVVHGARLSLSMGIGAVLISILVGGTLGAIAGYYGGKFDDLLMRIADIMLAIPGVLLVLALVAALGTGMINMLIAITIAGFPGFARVTRSVVLPVVDQEFVEAARAIGTRDRRIIIKNIIPNAVGPIIVQATMAIAGMIMMTSGLSFIGMGIQPPSPEWGAMLSSSRDYMTTSPHLVIIPGMMIILAALAFNLFGDGLRDALDPRLKD